MEDCNNTHSLNETWTLYAHLPHDTDWGINSYKKILTFETIEEAVVVTESIPHVMIKNCMLFLMRGNIKPIWEDPSNIRGGSFSYKVSNKVVPDTWRTLTYAVVGETLGNTIAVQSLINGITISPKKKFCVIKVWMATCNNLNPNVIKEITPELTSYGCLFKKHNT
jgi:hypothetical protein